jgi:SAM-dependent methyltransferase
MSAHLEFLRRKIYQVDTKWPHFGGMLDEVAAMARDCKADQTTVCLERAYVYGGDSLFAPLFTVGKFISVDCEIETTRERGGYQKDWMNDPSCTHIQANFKASATATGLPSGCADLLLVPNVLHHVKEQDALFAEVARLIKPGGTGYIFEALLRELHQAPDDYVRYTPWGFEEMLARHGLTMTRWTPSGGPFEAIAYCWVQALQYLPPEERADKERWFFEEHFPQLMALDRRQLTNLQRKHTSFPVAYGIHFRKPAEG